MAVGGGMRGGGWVPMTLGVASGVGSGGSVGPGVSGPRGGWMPGGSLGVAEGT